MTTTQEFVRRGHKGLAGNKGQFAHPDYAEGDVTVGGETPPVNPAMINAPYGHADIDERYELVKTYLTENPGLDNVAWLSGQIKEIESQFGTMEEDRHQKVKEVVNREASLIARAHLKATLPAPKSSFMMEQEFLTGLDFNDVVEVTPEKAADTKRLLKNSRGIPDRDVRMVRVNHYNSPDNKPGERIPIVGPKDGRPILIDIGSGIPSLEVTSGKAIIAAHSSWGNSIDVAAGAEAVVIADPENKVTCEVAEGGKLTLMVNSENNRTRAYGKGEVKWVHAQDAHYPTVTDEEAAAPYVAVNHHERWAAAKRYLRAREGQAAYDIYDKGIRIDNGIGFSSNEVIVEDQRQLIEEVRALAATR